MTTIQALRRVIAAIALLYVCWLGMMAVHELGHMLHAWISGGRSPNRSIWA